MPPPIESVLGQVQRDSLEIVDFIFHIIDPEVAEEDRVIFLDEVQLQEKQKQFFLDRLRDVAEGTQYVFKADAVHLKEKCEQLLAEPDRFNEISRHITQDFAGRHKEQMSAGVFVVALVKYLESTNNWQKLILLVKMDKRPSFAYTHTIQAGRRVAVMSEVPNALSETKAAVQKSAVIDVANRFAWDVLGFDRVKRPLLSDYYKAFLGVTERQQDSEWTRVAHATVKKWAKKLNPEQMPPGEDVFSYTGRAHNYLKDHDTFDTDGFLDTVIRDDNAERKLAMQMALREELAVAGVAGQQFRPKPESLPRTQTKQVYQTAEGVTIMFEGDKVAAGLKIETIANGGKLITIQTNRLDIKS